jgi:CBS domain containing-hemolysin-like protein
MAEFYFAIGLTLSFSFICSLLEAVILSTTPGEIEALKKKSPKRGALLSQFKNEIAETSSAILSVNTIVNTLGALWLGKIANETLQYTGKSLLIFSGLLTLSILLFAEILPKNIGVIYRIWWQGIIVYPLLGMRLITGPISWGCKHILSLVLRKKPEATKPADDIVFIVEKSAEDGTLTPDERTMIVNALSLDELLVKQILTPRSVVYGLPDKQTVEEVLSTTPNLPFSRIPLYSDVLDNCTGILRRRDLLKAKASGQENIKIADLAQEALFMSEANTAGEALRLCLKNHQKLAMVLDEFGSVAGVITLEDIFEHLLGQEIFEKDEVAIDMRALARELYESQQGKKASKKNTASPNNAKPAAS